MVLVIFMANICSGGIAVSEAKKTLILFDVKKNTFASIDRMDEFLSEDNIILMEVVPTDEDGWATSITNAWNFNDETSSVLGAYRRKSEILTSIKIKNFPENAYYVKLFRIGESGLLDWVVVHELVNFDEIRCMWLDPGFWLCVPHDENGQCLGTGKVLYFWEDDTLDYGDLVDSSKKMLERSREVLDINSVLKKMSRSDSDPFADPDIQIENE